jgi:hypothetical protein
LPVDRRPDAGRGGPRRLVAAFLLTALWPLGTATISGQQSPGEPVLGSPSGITREVVERVRLEVGMRLREQPDPRSLQLVTVDSATDVELLERDGDWMMVRFGAWRGWVHPNEPRPPAPLVVDRPVADSLVATDPDRRHRARLLEAAEILGLPPEPVEFGSFRLLTDVDDERLLDRLRGIALTLADLYWGRFSLEPGAAPHGDIVLFRDEADYRTFEGVDSEVASLAVAGHSIGSLAVTFVSQRSADETAVIWVHELTHLLNRKALGAVLPPWLEEGLANDLSFSRIDRMGRVEPGTLGGEIDAVRIPVQTGRGPSTFYSFTISGATAALLGLAEAQRRQQAPRLVRLTHLDRRRFFAPEEREMNYSTAGWAVRFLLDADAELTGHFHAYLERLGRGADHDPDLLADRIGASWGDLQRRFEAWVRKKAAQAKI